LIHPEYAGYEGGNVKFGCDIALAVVQIEFGKGTTEEARNELLQSLPTEDQLPYI